MKIKSKTIIKIGIVTTVILWCITGITYSVVFCKAAILSSIFTIGKVFTDPNDIEHYTNEY